jgi:hypothetical protein
MRHEILEEIWRVRGEISAECGQDLEKLSAMLKREELKHPEQLAKLPVVHKPKGEQINRRTQ